MNGQTILGILMVAVWLFNWGLAATVYLSAPHRSVNRWLSVVLFVEGASLGGFGWMNIGVGGTEAFSGFVAVHIVAWIPVTWLYMAFISRALSSPLARCAGHPVVTAVLATYAAAMIVLYFTTGDGLWAWDPPRLWAFAFTMLAVTGVYALLSAVQALRRATGVRRAQVRAYVLAFAARDGFFVAALVALPNFWFSQPLGGRTWLAWNFALAGAMLVFASLLTYGILKTQLFDIDLKLKWTLKRSSLLTGLAALFFVVKEGVEATLPLEGVVPSTAGATLVALVAFPLWRLAGRFADRVMPHVDDTAAYLDGKKAEIYRAQLEEALVDGDLGARDRVLMLRLQESLGLDVRTAERLERDVVAARGAA